MAKTDLNTLKNWFKNGLKPTQEHFWNWLDSFWHKDEAIPTSAVDGLDDLIADKVTNEQFNNHINDEDAHDIAGKADAVQDNFSRVIKVRSDELSGTGTLEDQICEYVNALNLTKQSDDADFWIEVDIIEEEEEQPV